MAVDFRTIRLKGDIEANWLLTDKIPRSRELLLSTDTGRLRIGDGVTLPVALPVVNETIRIGESEPWNKSIAAYLGTELATGTAGTTVVAATEKRAAITLASSGHYDATSIGDILWNETDNEWCTCIGKGTGTKVWIDRDIFVSGETYHVYDEPALPYGRIERTGGVLDNAGAVRASNTNTTNHLIDSGGTDWTTVAGLTANKAWAMNAATGRFALITSVAAHDLTLQWDAFPNGDEGYILFSDLITISDGDSPINGLIVPEMNISNRLLGGSMTSGVVYTDAFQAWQLGATADLTGARNYYSRIGNRDFAVNSSSTPTYSDMQSGTADQGAAQQLKAMSNGLDGTPRTLDYTRPRQITQTMIMRIK